MKSLPSVYDYLDVRQYLRLYREIRKENDPSFTNIYICFELGQKNSKGYFNNVINGRVKIGPTIVTRFIKLLDLDRRESSYFKILVKYSQCAEKNDKEVLLRKLISLNPHSCTEISKESISYYQHWRHAVIRALLDIIDFDGTDLDLLTNKLIISMRKQDIKKSFDLLLSNGMISKNSMGFYKPVDKSITHNSQIQQALLLQYQTMQFGHSQKVMLDRDVRPQKTTSMTLSISQETYSIVKEKIDILKSEIRALASNEQGKSEQLFQLNLHLFPHSKEL